MSLSVWAHVSKAAALFSLYPHSLRVSWWPCSASPLPSGCPFGSYHALGSREPQWAEEGGWTLGAEQNQRKAADFSAVGGCAWSLSSAQGSSASSAQPDGGMLGGRPMAQSLQLLKWHWCGQAGWPPEWQGQACSEGQKPRRL